MLVFMYYFCEKYYKPIAVSCYKADSLNWRLRVAVGAHGLSRVQLFAIPWPVAHQAPLWNFPGKNTGVGCCFLLQGNLPDPGIEPTSPHLLHW